VVEDAATLAEKATEALVAAASSAHRWAEIRDDLHSHFKDDFLAPETDRIRQLHNEIEVLAYAAGGSDTLDSPSREYIYQTFRRGVWQLCSESPAVADRVRSIAHLATQHTSRDSLVPAPAASLRLIKSNDPETGFQINVDIGPPGSAESQRDTPAAPSPRSALLANMRMEFYGDRTPAALSPHRLGLDPIDDWKPALLNKQVVPPVELLPARIYGRDDILKRLERLLFEPDGNLHALTGQLGVGKTTVALELARRALLAELNVWWVHGSADIMNASMIAVAGQLGTDPDELADARAGRRSVHDLVWRHLESADKRWLLIFDGVDDQSLMSTLPGKGQGYGWIRPSRKGLVLVSSGLTEFMAGQRHTVCHPIGPIDQDDVLGYLRDSGIRLSETGRADWATAAPYLRGSPFALNLVARYLAATSDAKAPAEGSTPAHAAELATRLAETGLDATSDPVFEILRAVFKWLSTSASLDALLLLGQVSYYAPDVPFPVRLFDRAILRETGILGGPGRDRGKKDEVNSALGALRGLGLAEVRGATAGSHDKADDGGFLFVHPLISRIWRDLLADQSPSQLSRVTIGAAKILAAATTRQAESTAEYERWYFLIPHVRALLGSLSERSPGEAIEAAVRAATDTVLYLTRTGAYQSAIRIGRSATVLGANLDEGSDTRLEMETAFAKALILRGSIGEARRILEGVLDVKQRTLGLEDPATLDTMEIIALLLHRQGRFSRAELTLRQVLKGRRRHADRDTAAQLQPMSDLARVLRQRGKLGEAERLGRQVWRTRRLHNGPNSPEFFESAIDLSITLLSIGSLTEAQAILRYVLKAKEHILGPEHRETISASVALAQVLRARGQLSEAEAILQKAVRRCHLFIGPDHRDTVDAEAALGQVLRDRGKLPDAERLLRDVLKARQRLLGPDHPDCLNAMLGLGVILNDTGQLDEAETILRELVRKSAPEAAAENPTLLSAYHNLGAVLQNKGMTEESEKHYRMVLAIREWSLGSNHPETLSTLANLGSLLRLKGMLTEAEHMLDQVRAAYTDLLGEGHPYTLTVKTNIASVYVDSGRPRDAAKAYREVLDVQKDVLGPAHPDTLLTRVNLGVALGECRDFAPGEVLLKSAVRSYENLFGATYPNLLTARYQLARVFERQCKLSAALAEYRQVADLMATTLGARHAETIAAQLGVSRVLLALGFPAESHAQYVRTIQVAASGNIQHSSLR
jgi:tetratricopeptide (TPR) repeat protein